MKRRRHHRRDREWLAVDVYARRAARDDLGRVRELLASYARITPRLPFAEVVDILDVVLTAPPAIVRELAVEARRLTGPRGRRAARSQAQELEQLGAAFDSAIAGVTMSRATVLQENAARAAAVTHALLDTFVDECPLLHRAAPRTALAIDVDELRHVLQSKIAAALDRPLDARTACVRSFLRTVGMPPEIVRHALEERSAAVGPKCGISSMAIRKLASSRS